MTQWFRFIHPLRLVAWSKRISLDAGRVLGPIFQVEAMLTVRRARYYLLRAAYGSILLFILWVSYQGAHGGGVVTMTLQSTARFAYSFFISFANAQLTIAMVVTAAVTAGTISEERERRTIEYLFATDLSNAEIVLGKLAARLFLVLLFLLAGLPVLSLTRLFGGIDAENLLQLFLVTASTVTVSASLSMFVSVSARRPREAVTRTFVILLGLIVLPWLAVFLAFLRPVVYQWISPLLEPLIVGNPFVFLMVLTNSRIPWPAAPSPGWPGVAELARNHAVLSLVMLALAIWRLRRVHLRAVTAPAHTVGAARTWRLFRPRLGTRPMLWKELFAEHAVAEMGIVSRLFVMLLFVAILAPLVREFYRSLIGQSRPDDFRALVGVLATIVSSLLLFVLAARAATSVTSEKERQSWETLLSTPLSAWDIVVGKMVGNIFALRWVVALLAVMWAMAIYLRPRALAAALTMTCTIVALGPLFVGMGMFFSLRSRGSTRAMCWTILMSLFIAGGYLLFAGPVTELLVANHVINRQQQESVQAGSAPYLLAWAANEEMRRPPNGIGTTSFVSALVGYFLLGSCVSLYNIHKFDRLAGRPRRSLVRWRAPRFACPRVEALSVGR